MRTVPDEFARTLIPGDKLSPNGRRYVYALSTGSPGGVHYIGQTVNPVARLKAHAEGYGATPELGAWLSFIRAQGETLHMHILEVCLKEERAVEQDWIQAYTNAGFKLLNQQVTPEYDYQPWKRPVRPLPPGFERV